MLKPLHDNVILKKEKAENRYIFLKILQKGCTSDR